MVRRRSTTDDDAWSPSKRGDTEMELDITPMIDVTFLLLIFFMVTSTMQPQTDLDVPSAKHGDGVETGSATMILIKASGGSDAPTIELPGGGTLISDASLEDVRAHVEQGIQKGNEQVIIKADRLVPHGFVQEVTRVVVEFEGIKFGIGIRDKRE